MEEDPYVLDDDIVKGMAVLKMALPVSALDLSQLIEQA